MAILRAGQEGKDACRFFLVSLFPGAFLFNSTHQAGRNNPMDYCVSSFAHKYKRDFLLLCTFTILLINSDLALAQDTVPRFNFTVDEFRKNLNDKIQEDTPDKAHVKDSIIKSCIKKDNSYDCKFNDAGFQYSIKEFKRLDLANGHFDIKLHLKLETQAGKVSRISVIGDRGDIVNLTQWAGTVINVMQTFDPDAGKEQGQIHDINKNLGLVRGDSADNIGEVVTDIKPYAQINCLSVPSSVSTKVDCQFFPRS